MTTKETIAALIKKQTIAHIQKQAQPIQERCRTLFRNAILTSPTWVSLTSYGGQLRQELGVEDTHRLKSIVDFFVSTLTTTVKVNKKSIALETHAVAEYSDMLKAAYGPDSYYVTSKGVEIQFIHWLLFLGTQPIVTDYYVKDANTYEIQYSRTHSKIMRGKQGAHYSITPQHAGTVDDNFITRVCNAIGNDILNTMRKSL